MIYSKLIDSTDVTVPVLAYTSTDTGNPVSSGGIGRTNAITTMILCNTGTPSLTDETVNSLNVSVYLVKSGDTYGAKNTIVSNLIVPAGETVFFSDEKIILDSTDEIYVGTSSADLLAFTISVLEV